MADSVDNVHYGLADITIDGDDVGYTVDGVTITPELSTVDLVVNEEIQPLDRMVTQFGYTITFTMAETTADNFVLYATGVGSGDDEGNLIGQVNHLAGDLVITASDQSGDDHRWTFEAGTIETGPIQYTKGQGWGIPITVKTLKGTDDHKVEVVTI
jgi:hypothetical protein